MRSTSKTRLFDIGNCGPAEPIPWPQQFRGPAIVQNLRPVYFGGRASSPVSASMSALAPPDEALFADKEDAMTQRTWPRFRIMFLSPFLSAVLVFSPWSGVQAQSNAPRPEALVVYPEGAVDVRHLPPPAEAQMAGNIPRHFPDPPLLIPHQAGLQANGPEAP